VQPASGRPAYGRSAGRPAGGRDGADRQSRSAPPSRDTGPRSGPAKSSTLPDIPAGITEKQLDPAAAAELRTLPSDLASAVGRRLLAASLADDPEAGYQHAMEARRLAARVGIVRETTGIAAYRAGHWAEALAELRAARRLTGRTSYLPLMADSERALGRMDRALGVIAEASRTKLDRETEVELRIVESGIRRDQGLAEAAVVVLQLPELKERRVRPWSARLFYAYADALLDAGRTEQAREWFARAAAADPDQMTDAAERFDDLDDVVIDDLGEDDEDQDDEDLDGIAPDQDDPDQGEDASDGDDSDGDDPDA
jgi:tetratricopeptide (TPR) repeat protein